uniref:UDP-N-acetylglucosamine--dolichyl-phosphate N-acetylglucosaminephosphotransferase-like n=1 Tax=Dermatophagoides pteronyssinus TaxID=6956 RepID=A0A6P6YBH3_DERPT|nr:UDP-N-acetylglucosamine--dolichyl-phosphate N-acetylglucosaminephosphotransferase-like [Dermatophagoides pteronyssinus]
MTVVFCNSVNIYAGINGLEVGQAIVIAIILFLNNLLFLISMPQIFNFIVSIPQLIGIIHCPIHRIPLINKKTNCLEPSNNQTLINYWLRIRSHLSELQLFRELMVLQCVTGALGLYIYHKQAS